MNAAIGNEDGFSIFKYGDTVVRFKAPYSLEKYTKVKKWDCGYLVVEAKYSHNQEDEEEYIDLVPIFRDLYIPESELKNITSVEAAEYL